jgi:hypothetical protein
MTELGEAIRRARGPRTRREFSDVIGATQNSIYSWEAGTNAPRTRPYIRALIKAGVSAELLAEGRYRSRVGTESEQTHVATP